MDYKDRTLLGGFYVKQLSVLLSCLFIINSTLAANFNSGYIVKLKKGVNPFVYEMHHSVSLEKISPNDLYLATPIGGTKVTAQSLAKAQSSEQVVLAQPNHIVTLRKGTPNDKDFDRQWNYRLDEKTFGVDALSAWDMVGHKNQMNDGREVVIAVVDGGFDINHDDLIANKWVNKDEIPGNNIDDDGDGYIDDINGWDVATNTGKINTEEHGTHVAGIMGAQGDNGLNGTGINWNIKIMYVSAGWALAQTDETMRAYGYILKQKQLWIESNGKKGANVVAINSSFGIDRGDCSTKEYAVWNDMFNDLGKAGVLSVAATANAAWNIDETGDIPTACNSPYLIAVTNTDIDGKRSEAGYGKTSIDLGAPGEFIYSTLPDNSFGSMSGTSMASPHVTGSVGFLMTAASDQFVNNYMKDPGAAVLELKSIMLSTVTPRQDLKEETTSGGILNLAAASKVIRANAPRCNL